MYRKYQHEFSFAVPCVDQICLICQYIIFIFLATFLSLYFSYSNHIFNTPRKCFGAYCPVLRETFCLMLKKNVTIFDYRSYDTGFSWFPCVCNQMLRWFPRFQVATTCFSCSPPDLNLVETNFMFCLHVK